MKILGLSLLLLSVAAPALAEGVAPVLALPPSGKACLMGAVDAAGHVLDIDAARPKVRGGEAFRLLGLDGRSLAASGSQPVDEDVCTDVVTLDRAPDDAAPRVAIGGNWPLLPRPIKVQDPDQPTYRKAVLDWLASQGIAARETVLKSVIRLDVDGDGTEEVLLVAEHFGPHDIAIGADAGDHSVILLRRLVQGQVRTVLVTGNLHARSDPDGLREYFQIAAIADVDGNGTLDLVAYSQYYEGDGTEAWRLTGTPQRLFGCGCGL